MSEWQPIETAPFGIVLEVRNELMKEPCLATRGYANEGVVNPDMSLFTTEYTPHKFFPTPKGRLCCPTEWRLSEPPEDTP